MYCTPSRCHISPASKGQSYYPLCSSEPFRYQPTTAYCSAFPIGPDLIATAGHCVDASTCAPGGGDTAFVFGFQMQDSSTVRSRVGADDVYYCDQLIAKIENSDTDFAVLKVDRPIVGHEIMEFRRSGYPGLYKGLVVSGCPSGLPVKVAGNAEVKGTCK